jgi:hypothetical protein
MRKCGARLDPCAIVLAASLLGTLMVVLSKVDKGNTILDLDLGKSYWLFRPCAPYEATNNVTSKAIEPTTNTTYRISSLKDTIIPVRKRINSVTDQVTNEVRRSHGMLAHTMSWLVATPPLNLSSSFLHNSIPSMPSFISEWYRYLYFQLSPCARSAVSHAQFQLLLVEI